MIVVCRVRSRNFVIEEAIAGVGLQHHKKKIMLGKIHQIKCCILYTSLQYCIERMINELLGLSVHVLCSVDSKNDLTNGIANSDN